MGASDERNTSHAMPVMASAQSRRSLPSKSQMTAEELNSFLAIIQKNDLKLRQLAEERGDLTDWRDVLTA